MNLFSERKKLEDYKLQLSEVEATLNKYQGI